MYKCEQHAEVHLTNRTTETTEYIEKGFIKHPRKERDHSPTTVMALTVAAIVRADVRTDTFFTDGFPTSVWTNLRPTTFLTHISTATVDTEP